METLGAIPCQAFMNGYRIWTWDLSKSLIVPSVWNVHVTFGHEYYNPFDFISSEAIDIVEFRKEHEILYQHCSNPSWGFGILDNFPPPHISLFVYIRRTLLTASVNHRFSSSVVLLASRLSSTSRFSWHPFQWPIFGVSTKAFGTLLISQQQSFQSTYYFSTVSFC